MKNARNLGVTFSKRRAGLFRKACELCTLCGAEIAIVIFSQDVGIRELNTKLMNLDGAFQMEKNRGESLREIRKRADGVWWESPIEELNLFQLQHLKKALEILKQKVEKETQMVNNNAFPFQTLGSAWTRNCSS
ncbi:hypothetical protein RDI58_010558 [Solanum bulbocastanum]|uniref:MADS-box domain-containing protein n=1 Tax=Solanum bulbocastanum TaxID=147425 RepID=A0AAN8TU56_SOLBU